MEALLATAGLLVVVLLALTVLARTWPRSSHLGGYHVEHPGSDGESGPKVREEYEADWNWRDRNREP